MKKTVSSAIPYPPSVPEDVWLDLLGAGRWWWHVPSDVDWYDAGYARLAGLDKGTQRLASRPSQLWRDSIHPEDLPQVLEAVEQLLDSDGRCPYEAVYRHQTAAGWRWVMSRGRVVARASDGRIEWVAGICLDIHKTMQATQLAERDELWLTAFDRLVQGFRYITVYGPEGQATEVEFVSPGIEDFYSIPVHEVIRNAEVLRQRLPPQDRKQIQQDIARAIQSRASSMTLHYRIMPRQGQDQVRHLQALARGEYLPDGRSRWYGVAIDVTEEAQLREELQRKVEQLQTTLSVLPDIWLELDADERYRAVHTPDPSLLLAPPEQLIGRRIEEVLPSELLERVRDAMLVTRVTGEPQKLRYTLERPDGVHHFEACVTARQHHGVLAGYTCLVRDITDAVQSFEQRQQALLHDSLTGLWNRAGFQEEAWARWLELAAAREGAWVLVLLDIDALRQVNQTLGSLSGDRLLLTVVQRLRQIDPDGLLARLGADELLALVPAPVPSERLAEWVAQQHHWLSQPVTLADFDYHPSLSMAWCLLPQPARDAPVDLAHAISQVEEGLLLVKERARGHVMLIDSSHYERTQRRHQLALALSSAMHRGELWLAMQPIVQAKQPARRGVEALLRWRSREFGDISPVEFIALAEQSGMVVDIGQWVLQQACLWAARHPEVEYVAVNISPLQFMHAKFVQQVQRALKDSGLPPQRLCLEVTESLLAQDLQAVRTTLEQLATNGIRFALDDFGTGYSNLMQLSELPLDELKIDRSFVHQLPQRAESVRIVRTLINLAHGLRMTVVAEGVETLEQAEWLRRHGCDALQGYLYGKPVAAAEWPS